MSTTKKEQIEKINQDIVALMLKRKQAQRWNDWAEECQINEQIAKLEKQIKQIEAE